MKNYKEYKKRFIGASDIASLIMVGCESDGKLKLQELPFGSDGSYSAYVVDKDAEIGNHYKQVAEFHSWLKIYDDNGLAMRFDGNRIVVYCAGEMGCIIQLCE